MQGPHHLSVPMDEAFRRYAGGDTSFRPIRPLCGEERSSRVPGRFSSSPNVDYSVPRGSGQHVPSPPRGLLALAPASGERGIEREREREREKRERMCPVAWLMLRHVELVLRWGVPLVR